MLGRRDKSRCPERDESRDGNKTRRVKSHIFMRDNILQRNKINVRAVKVKI